MLTAEDFPAFYQQVHGYQPFFWQRDFATAVLRDGRWPQLVDVPTGLGKTSMLDVAVFVAAATAGQVGARRVGRRRCLFVVDRRIVVDEVTAHATAIAAALRAAEATGGSGAVGAVAAGLRSLSRAPMAQPPLVVTRMRGGATWAAAWLERPDQPGIVVATVDQVGSRLLFRGYGVSQRRRPIDAGLVGTDAVLMVDEAHLATALLTTVTAAGHRDQLGLPLPGLDVVRLTATAGTEASGCYPFDLAAHDAEPEARRRLHAAKRLHPVLSTPKGCVADLADAALRLATGEPPSPVADADPPGSWPPAVLVVCNTVDRARAVHGRLQTATTARDGSSIVDLDLLIGRSRPADRADLTDQVLGRFGVGRTRADRPAILVATQTVEVGVNLDADGLVTESASWDAIVQRLGRLDRLGRRPHRQPGPAAAAVVVHDGQEDGPVYGTARDLTWQQLSTLVPAVGDVGAVDTARGGLGVSPVQCRQITAAMPAAVTAPRPEVPLLDVTTLDAWAATAPVPHNDPPVAPYLHGCDAALPAVQVVWRDGLVVDDPLDDPFEDSAEASTRMANLLLTAMPPRPDEQVEVPFVAARQWLAGQSTPPVGDLESAPDFDDRSRPSGAPIPVLAWRGDTDTTASPDGWTWITSERLRPGDQIVVPAVRGGLDRFGWRPDSKLPVTDVAERAAFTARRPMLRIDAALPDRLGLTGPVREQIATLVAGLYRPDQDAPPADAAHRLVTTLTTALDDPTATDPEQHHPALGVARTAVRSWLASTPRLVALSDQDRAVVIGGDRPPQILLWLLTGGRVGTTGTSAELDLVEPDDEQPAASCLSSRQVPLDQHLTAVRARATAVAEALRLPPELASVIADAAGWHDLGKVEERFQAMLHGGDRYAAAVAPWPLAKSGMRERDRAAWQLARRRSGLPPGARHEAWSQALVAAHLAQQPAPYPGDVDLLLHLIASHHGHARPLLPLVADRSPTTVAHTINASPVAIASDRTVDLDHPGRFARLNARYGRWGLALLETIVRCADMTVSAEGS